MRKFTARRVSRPNQLFGKGLPVALAEFHDHAGASPHQLYSFTTASQARQRSRDCPCELLDNTPSTDDENRGPTGKQKETKEGQRRQFSQWPSDA